MEQGSGRKERIKALFKKGQRCLVRYSDQYWAALVRGKRQHQGGGFGQGSRPALGCLLPSE